MNVCLYHERAAANGFDRLQDQHVFRTDDQLVELIQYYIF